MYSAVFLTSNSKFGSGANTDISLPKKSNFIDTSESRHCKIYKMSVHPAKTEITRSDQSLRCPYEETLGP